MTNTPLVSIIIPTYNRAHVIEETLKSVLSQIYKNWECIVIDDVSLDNTSEIVEAYCENDKRFQYYKRPIELPKGANACRNYGFKLSKGTYINWLDSDDLLQPNKLEAQIPLILKDTFSLITTPWGRFDNSERLIPYQDYKSYGNFEELKVFLDALVKSKGYFPIHAYLMSRSIIQRSGLWSENLKINQDGEFMSRIFKYVNKFYCANEAAVFYRNASNASTSAYTSVDKAEAAIKVWRTISKRLEQESVGYMFFMKMQLYKNLKKTFPQLISNNFLFFKKIIFYNWYKDKLIYKIIKKYR